MPDRQSTHRTLRVNIHPSATPGAYSWAALAIAIKGGVPTSNLVGTGHAYVDADLTTERGLWLALQDLAAVSLR